MSTGAVARAPPAATANSSSRIAVIKGFPKIAPTAAMPPASIMTWRTGLCGLRKASAPSAVPMAISGASGPRTAPKDSDPSAARITERISRGPMSRPKPSSGECPAWPGSFIAPKVIRAPVTSRTMTSHQGAAA